MKKFFTLFAVAMMAFASQANVLTVCDAESTNSYVPIYGLYVDVEGTMGQMIYPAEMLTDMVGAEISELTFYSPGINFSDATLQLGMTTTDKNDYEDYAAVEGATVLGSITPESGDTEMTFVFDEPFVYEGGNLMVQVLVTTPGTWRTTYFYGEDTPYYYSYHQYQTTYSSTPSTYHVAFLPKATFTYEKAESDPHMQGNWLVVKDMFGNDNWFELQEGSNDDYVTSVSLEYYTYGLYDPDYNAPVPFYFMVNGVRYGAEAEMTEAVLGQAMENPLVESEEYYTVPVGFSYALGIAMIQGEMYVYAAQAYPTSVDELNAGKTVAGVRYFNLAGQEMQQANGMTIVVTTYTDGTTSAAKVIK